MAGNSLAEQFKELEAASTSYAEHTTRLSHLIVSFENGLNCLAGKIAVRVADEKRGVRVSFSRDGKGAWKLWYSMAPYASVSSLTRAPIEAKVECVAVFPAIVEAMIQEFSARLTRVEQASEAVSHLVEQLHGNGKESA